MLLVPVLVVLILERTREASYAAAAVLVLGGLSDGLDGYLARRHHMSTRTGAWLDPLSDKLLVVAPMLTLAAISRFPWWGAVAIVARPSPRCAPCAVPEGRPCRPPRSPNSRRPLRSWR